FGRDAVLWSPPHMLAIFGSLALLVGFLTGAQPDTPRWILTGLGALLLGGAAVPVLEYETDVPQFSETLYLPVLLAATLFATMLLRQLLPGPLPPLRRPKTTDHGHGRVVRPFLGALLSRRASTLVGFPAHSGSMQQCRRPHP
ncbi:MAG TPA: hypothetical protein VJ735_21470, partial [Actinomycetes bacterium]|nr:hypothetical protein [Actinomycetes bacterium]